MFIFYLGQVLKITEKTKTQFKAAVGKSTKFWDLIGKFEIIQLSGSPPTSSKLQKNLPNPSPSVEEVVHT